MVDNARILELRRRVQADPASIAFAPLAEECRRAGNNDEAVGICRAGLVHHRDFLSARVTLGRALVEIGRLDEAFEELSLVFERAPTNLAAIRALAEVYQRRGQMTEALQHYRLALSLARYDTDLEDAVERIEQEVAPAPPVIEELFDFDTLMSRLAPEVPQGPPIPDAPVVAAPSALDAVELPADAGDLFAELERQLREGEEERLREEQLRMAAEHKRIEEERQRQLADERLLAVEQQRIADEQRRIAEAELARELEAERQRALILQELEEWLSAIAVDRQHQRSA